jgi:hypothetical protein
MEEQAASLGSSGLEVAVCSSESAAVRSEVPNINLQHYTGAMENEVDVETGDSAPASPITVNTMQQLLKRPFPDVLKEITATMQVSYRMKF